jgi:hypothetical protein
LRRETCLRRVSRPICSHFFPLGTTIEIVKCLCQWLKPGFFSSCTKTYVRKPAPRAPQAAKCGRTWLIDQILAGESSLKELEKPRTKSRPISRVLSWAIIPLGRASPRASSGLPGSARESGAAVLPPRLPYLALLQVGFAMPPVLPPARCALTAPFHPCQHRLALRRFPFCCTFRGLAPPRRYLAP